VRFAVGANASHGLKRTNRGKRNAVMTLLRDPEWSLWSNVEIADRCLVSEFMVRQHRASLRENRSEPQPERTYTNKHGSTSTMNTANIGARPAPAVVTPAPEWRQTDIEDVARYGGVICPAA
jgi:hypothetical protein